MDERQSIASLAFLSVSLVLFACAGIIFYSNVDENYSEALKEKQEAFARSKIVCWYYPCDFSPIPMPPEPLYDNEFEREEKENQLNIAREALPMANTVTNLSAIGAFMFLFALYCSLPSND